MRGSLQGSVLLSDSPRGEQGGHARLPSGSADGSGANRRLQEPKANRWGLYGFGRGPSPNPSIYKTENKPWQGHVVRNHSRSVNHGASPKPLAWPVIHSFVYLSDTLTMNVITHAIIRCRSYTLTLSMASWTPRLILTRSHSYYNGYIPL
jgi:hypothetical protein